MSILKTTEETMRNSKHFSELKSGGKMVTCSVGNAKGLSNLNFITDTKRLALTRVTNLISLYTIFLTIRYVNT